MFKLMRFRRGERVELRGRSGSLVDVLDLSGPLPGDVQDDLDGLDEPDADDGAVLPHADETPRTEAVAQSEWLGQFPPMGSLPRDMDPFECDYPWTGWTEPHYQAVIRSPHRSPTFERDLERVLAIFAH